MADISQQAAAPRRALPDWLLSPWAIVVAVPVLVGLLDTANLVPVVTNTASSFASTAPIIVFAVLLLAYLKAAGAETVVANAFKGRETRMIFLAALLGGLAPFCSCEVIPFIAGLLALGAPLSAVMAFWLSSPLIDPPTLLITAAALGWSFAVGKAVAAVGIGLMGGFLVKAVRGRGFLRDPLRARSAGGCGCACSTEPQDEGPAWAFWKGPARRAVFGHEFRLNSLFLAKWLAFAYTLQALLVTYVPADLIAGVVGGEGIVPIATAAIVGMPAYLNSYVAPPLLAGLTQQGMSAGAAMAFMVAGAISSVPAMAAVWSLVQPRVFTLYLGLGVGGAILSGMLFQAVL